MKKRRLGAILAAGALLLTFAGMAVATARPTSATTESTFTWGGQGWPNETCTASSASMLWVWTGDSPTSLTINGEVQAGTWVKMGGGSGAWHFTATIDATNYPPKTASVTYTGSAGVLTLSDCEGTTTTTTSSTTSTASSETTGTSTSESETSTASTTTGETETSTSSTSSESTFIWGGQGWPNETCTASSTTMLWVWTGDNPTSLTINGQVQTGTWVKMGGGSGAWHFTVTINSTNYPPVTASVTYTGSAGILTLSDCEGTTTTTTSSSTTQSETSGTTTASSSTTESETTGSTTSESETSGTTTASSSTTESETSGTTTASSSTTASETTGGSTTATTTSESETGSVSATTSSESETTSASTTEEETTGNSTSTSTTASGSVAGETGSVGGGGGPTVTPPATDTLGSTTSQNGSGPWNAVLALGVVLSLSILVLSPVAKSRRRK